MIKNPGGSGRSPSDGGKTGSGSSGSGGSNGGDKKPPVVPTEAPTITRSRGPFAGREDVELCTETADFNKNLSSMFKVDYCPSNVVMREGGGALLMKVGLKLAVEC